MPNTLTKNLNICFSLLLKRPQPQLTTPQSSHIHHLNNQNMNYHYNKNYNSLYEDFPPPPHTSASLASPSSSVSTNYVDTEDIIDAVGSTTPDLTAIYASRRFFISSPGRSNSIVDSLSLSSSTLLSPAEESSSSSAEVAGGVPVQTYSPDPYVDFRRSMQEMVEARGLVGNLEVNKEAWEYLQELLLSYLALNPKNTHKYIVGAFTDLVVSLMSPNNNNYKNTSINDCSSLSSFSSCRGDNVSDDNHKIGGGYV